MTLDLFIYRYFTDIRSDQSEKMQRELANDLAAY